MQENSVYCLLLQWQSISGAIFSLLLPMAHYRVLLVFEIFFFVVVGEGLAWKFGGDTFN